MNPEQVYARLPLPAQNLACTAVGTITHLRRYNRDFGRRLRDGETRMTWDETALMRYRDARVVTHARQAVADVPYYRRLAAEHGFGPDDLQSVEDVVERFPVLPKQTVRESPELFVRSHVPGERRRGVSTSGSTGTSLRFPTSVAAQREQWACYWRYWRALGITRRTTCGWFAGRRVVPLATAAAPFWRVNAAQRQILFSGYHLSAATVSAYVDALRARRVTWIHGYPSQIATLAALMLDGDRRLPREQIAYVTLAAENSTPLQHQLIEAAFGVRPHQHYGNTEAAGNASECRFGVLHVDEDFGYLEPWTPATGPTRIIGTNFTNPFFPLIRYDVGDVGTLGPQQCRCGRPGRALTDLDGRSDDFVLLPSGARVARLGHVFKAATGVREGQIHQTDPTRVILRVVPAREWDAAAEQALLTTARGYLGNDLSLSVEVVDEIARTPGGKFRFVLSDLDSAPADEASA